MLLIIIIIYYYTLPYIQLDTVLFLVTHLHPNTRHVSFGFLSSENCIWSEYSTFKQSLTYQTATQVMQHKTWTTRLVPGATGNRVEETLIINAGLRDCEMLESWERVSQMQDFCSILPYCYTGDARGCVWRVARYVFFWYLPKCHIFNTNKEGEIP